MKHAVIILAVLICSCAKPNSEKIISSDSVTSIVENKNKYDSLSTTNCVHTNLSNQFDITVNFHRYTNTKEMHDSCLVKLYLTEKETKTVTDTISITSHFYFDKIFKDCNNVLSYATKTNIDKGVVDNYYGDIIVADLNFDEKDDIVVINDSGGNGGTFYSYFIQGDNHKFALEQFLTDSMTYFPSKINKKEKTLVTYVHAGVCGLGEHIYLLNQNTNQWAQKSHRIIDICKDSDK